MEDCAQRRHRHPLSARPHERRAAPADDHGRLAERPHRRDRGHLRRLPGPRQGDVQRRPVPRADEPQRGEQHQLGAGDGPGRLLRRRRRVLRGPLTFCVPTGNFGNVLSGWIASRWARRSTASCRRNTNDILTRFINDNDMSTAPVVPTLSPSMDIQVSSNFERLLFEMNGRDGGMTAEQLQRFRATGRLAVEPTSAPIPRRHVRRATGRRRGDARRHRPHLRVDRGCSSTRTPRSGSAPPTAYGRVCGPMVTLATAHPAKFPTPSRRHRYSATAAAASGRPDGSARVVTQLPNDCRRRGSSSGPPLVADRRHLSACVVTATVRSWGTTWTSRSHGHRRADTGDLTAALEARWLSGQRRGVGGRGQPIRCWSRLRRPARSTTTDVRRRQRAATRRHDRQVPHRGPDGQYLAQCSASIEPRRSATAGQ